MESPKAGFPPFPQPLLRKRLVLTGSRRIDDLHARVDADGVSETTGVGVGLPPEKRIRRTAEEKLRIVEATLEPGASIARVAREHGRA